MTPRIHSSGTVALSLVMMLIGVALLVEALGERGSIISARLLLGIMFLAAGAGRLYMEARKRDRGS